MTGWRRPDAGDAEAVPRGTSEQTRTPDRKQREKENIMKIYNTLTRKKEEFVPLEEEKTSLCPWSRER